tara:strand:- start:856 stop:1095 length:240 start_codon:yes stop_codon:yes gene_type:complete
MSNLKIYSEVFSESLGINESLCNDKLEYNGVEEWDSIGHMTLIAALEEKFKISIETDDIVDFSSYKKGREILQKYKVEF